MGSELILLTGKRIALIGGAGFIGHHLAATLKLHGAKVIVIDDMEVNNRGNFARMGDDARAMLYLEFIGQRAKLLQQNQIPLHIQDARDQGKLANLLDEFQPSFIVHLASISHAGRTNSNPHLAFEHGLRTLASSLEWSRGNNSHLIFFSSSMVYGDFNTSEITEDHPLQPKEVYGTLKLTCESLIKTYSIVYGLPYTIVRPSALYGPRCVSRRVIQIFIENAMNGKETTVQGDGSERLDFTFIDDLVQGVVLVIDNPNSRNQSFNLTYGQSRSLNELVDLLLGHFPDLEVSYSTRSRLAPLRGTLNTEKARELLGYSPTYPLEQGIQAYVGWYKAAVVLSSHNDSKL